MFGAKGKGIFVDLAGDTALVARTTGLKPPFTVEEIREIPLGNEAEAIEAIRAFSGVRGAGFTTATCAVYPKGRIAARVALDPRKFRDDGYLADLVRETLKIDPAEHSLFTLSTVDGSDVSLAKAVPRDVLVCGAPTAELTAAQDRLLELGIYPLRMEIGTIAAQGGIVNHLSFVDSKVPLLLLEIGPESTNVFIATRDGIEITRAVAFGINSMIPQVQRELGLKDEESAKKLFFSNSFDFTGMGAQLTKRLVRELQASIGFYEVQTGQSVAQLCCTLIPSKVAWLERTLADVLGMKVLEIDRVAWLKAMGIEFAMTPASTGSGAAWTGLFCLMGQYKGRQDEAAA